MMALRLPRWWRRHPVPAGRHVRVLPSVGVPGAAATIVASASLDPRVTSATVAAGPPRGPVVPLPLQPPAGVGLVFADGASVELDSADPRVPTFQAAAAALLDQMQG